MDAATQMLELAMDAPAAFHAAPGCVLPVPYYDAGGITIYHGDCRQIMPLLAQFDLLMADPPYGLGMDKEMHKLGGAQRGKALAAKRHYAPTDWDAATVDDWVMFLARRLATKQIIFGGNYYDLPPAKCWLLWDKEVNGQFADAEMAWTNLDKPVRLKRHMWNGMLRKGQEERSHPTQKPLEVIQWAIQQAGEVQTILDPWAGSGTTGHAAKNLGKRAVLIEREERYCEVAARRLAQDVLPLHTHNCNYPSTG